jgi:hypothetical protein
VHGAQEGQYDFSCNLLQGCTPRSISNEPKIGKQKLVIGKMQH